MLALTATTGKIGGATLDAILEHALVPRTEMVVLTSSSPAHERFAGLASSGTKILQARYEEPAEMERALRGAGVDQLLLVSTPAIAMDFGDAPLGEGREQHHFAVIDAAVKAGVKHIYYTSLAFQDGSQAGVMRAHFRTEAYLKQLHVERGLQYTIIRMGLYNESWPLYLGHYNIQAGGERRSEIVVAGDGPISWTSVADLGLATALVLASPVPSRYTNQTIYLSQPATATLAQVCEVAAAVGHGGSKMVKVVSMEEYVEYYTSQLGMDRAMLEWWVTTYPSLVNGLCHINDSTLSDLLATRGKQADSIESTVQAMLAGL